MKRWFRRRPVDEELLRLREENARLRHAVATYQIAQWMHAGQGRRPRVDPERTQITPASALRRSR